MSSKPEKKRKKKDSQDEPPNKKKAVSYNDKPISVNVVEKPGPLRPCFLDAPGLELSRSTVFQSYVKEKPSSSQKSSRNTSEILLHSASHPRLDYVGREPPPGSFDQLTSHYVGVYDPATSSLQIVPAKQVTVRSSLKRAFAVDQKLAAAESRAEREAGEATTDAERKEKETAGAKYLAARNALGEAFGTKKAQKAQRSAAANAVTSPAKGSAGGSSALRTEHSEAVLASANAQIKLEGDEEDGDRDERKAALSSLVNEAHPRPTPRVDAETPADIYRLASVIGKQELELIDITDWATAINGNTTIETHSRFVSNRFLGIAKQNDASKIKALKFLLLMIRWANALEIRGENRQLPKKGLIEQQLSEYGVPILRKIKRRFVPGGSMLNPWDVQKLMLHICAIAIVLDDCESDTHDLQEDLRLTGKEIRNFYKQLGCKVDVPTEKDLSRRGLSKAEASKHQIAKLSVPFSLPEVRQRRTRR